MAMGWALVSPKRTEIVTLVGKYVLVEKPMVISVDGAVEMVRICRAHDVKLGGGFHLRHHPG